MLPLHGGFRESKGVAVALANGAPGRCVTADSVRADVRGQFADAADADALQSAAWRVLVAAATNGGATSIATAPAESEQPQWWWTSPAAAAAPSAAASE